MSEPIEIALFPEGNEGASLRWHNAPGEDFRPLLMNQGNHGSAVKTRAVIAAVASGSMTPGGQAASLVILEFQFQTPPTKVKHRFKSAKIQLTFQDVGDGRAKSHHTRDPVVKKIAPEGDLALNPRTTTKSTTQAWHGNFNAGYQALVGGGIGYDWGMTRDITSTHYTSLGGTTDNVRAEEYGKDNAATWWLEEDKETEGGIPKWLRTAVLLERSHDGPFRVDLSVETNVDFAADPLSFFGFGRKELNDPVTIRSSLSLGRPGQDDELTRMEDLDLVDSAKVAFATPIETE